MSIFPGAIASFLGFTSSHTLSADQHASQHNSEQAEIVAAQTKIGTGSSTPTSGLLLRGTGAGTSSWAQANLTSDVTGVLPQASGGTGTTLATGTGKAVYDTSPTISGASLTSSPTLTTPTIASFVNAIHNHESNTGGGTLNAANALQAGSVSFANLLSTIFGGQVTSAANAGSAGGTNYYVNLGGIKLLWCTTGTFNVTGTGGQNAPSAVITYPAGFFSTVSAFYHSLGVQGGTNSLYSICTAQGGAASLTVALRQEAGTNGSGQVNVLVIGT